MEEVPVEEESQPPLDPEDEAKALFSSATMKSSVEEDEAMLRMMEEMDDGDD